MARSGGILSCLFAAEKLRRERSRRFWSLPTTPAGARLDKLKKPRPRPTRQLDQTPSRPGTIVDKIGLRGLYPWRGGEATAQKESDADKADQRAYPTLPLIVPLPGSLLPGLVDGCPPGTARGRAAEECACGSAHSRAI